MIGIIKKDDYAPFKRIGSVYIVSWNPKEQGDNITCNQESIKLNKHMSYEQIVAKLIRVRYTSDEEIALINNALLDLGYGNIKEAFKEYEE